MPPAVRRARPRDAAGMARVRIAAWRSAYRGIVADSVLDGLDLAQEATRFAARVGANPERTELVAVNGSGQVTGYCLAGPDRDAGEADVGEVYAIYVAPGSQRRGVGTALLSEAVQGLRGAGYHELHVWALTANTRAIRFYEAHGWRRDDTERELPQLPGPDGGPTPELRLTLEAGTD